MSPVARDSSVRTPSPYARPASRKTPGRRRLAGISEVRSHRQLLLWLVGAQLRSNFLMIRQMGLRVHPIPVLDGEKVVGCLANEQRGRGPRRKTPDAHAAGTHTGAARRSRGLKEFDFRLIFGAARGPKSSSRVHLTGFEENTTGWRRVILESAQCPSAWRKPCCGVAGDCLSGGAAPHTGLIAPCFKGGLLLCDLHSQTWGGRCGAMRGGRCDKKHSFSRKLKTNDRPRMAVAAKTPTAPGLKEGSFVAVLS